MNNPIDYAISKVNQQIPSQLLTKAFTQKDIYNPNQSVSPEFIIRTQIIEQVVLPDLNVFGGQHVNINISNIHKRFVDSGYLLEIPLEKTQGMHLTSVSVAGTDNGGLSTSGSLTGMANAIMNASMGYESGFTGGVRIVGPNVVLVESNVILHSLSGTIGYDNRISSLDKFYWNDFSRLVVLATKSIIYNKFILELGTLSSNNAAPNQYIVSLVENYEGAMEEYNTMLNEEMTKILILADPLAKAMHIKYYSGRF